MNLEERIANAVNEKLTDGTVEKLVEQQIEKAVKDALEDTFRYGGKGKKMIEERLNEVIVPVIERHDFNRYIVKLDAVLTDIVNNTSLESNKKILENFRGLMKEPEKKEIKLSEIFKEYCKYPQEPELETKVMEEIERKVARQIGRMRDVREDSGRDRGSDKTRRCTYLLRKHGSGWICANEQSRRNHPQVHE